MHTIDKAHPHCHTKELPPERGPLLSLTSSVALSSSVYLFKNYLFMAALGLRRCARASRWGGFSLGWLMSWHELADSLPLDHEGRSPSAVL